VPYPIIHVPSDAPEIPEALGTKPKFWYSDSDSRLTLYKEGRPDSGEHWAEKICCEICRLLEIPHANYELAEWRGRKGVISQMFVPDGGRLVFGNELLAKMIPDYPHTRRFRARQHTVRLVMAVTGVRTVLYPLGYQAPAGFRGAADVFAGYLLLDDLVANQDRHHENWGIIIVPDQGVMLSPTFDHASSLGRNERDEERLRRLSTRDKGSALEHYAGRAISAFYPSPSSTKPLTTLEAFAESAKISPHAAQYWRDRLASISMYEIESIVEQVPAAEMSDPARQFAVRLMEINRDRILNL
jgi:hypothetical protein